MGTKLYVGNLPFSVTSQELSDLFSQAGEVVSANIITDRFSGQSRGFGFVEMANEDSAHTAVGQFNDFQMKGRGLKVNEAKPREGGRGGGGGGGGGGDRGGGDRGSGRRW
ncbi:MAG: RNA-binding protein [Candidatus Binatia bacterium]